MKLSIIVPVYNVEAFLNKCVDSLLAQDLSKEDYEVILVDDGSTDSSGALCDTLAAEHGNIRVIHQQNRGLSGARNAGIPVASGTYVLFVDSDDFLCPNVLGTLVGLMESKELDILRFNYQNVNMDGAVFEPNKYVKPFVDYSDVVCDGETFLNERLGYACYAWQFLVKASILRQEGNGFKEGIYFEDVEWTPRILLQALLEGFAALKPQVKDDRWFRGMSSQIALSIFDIVGRFFYPERKEYIRALKRQVAFPLSTYHATKSSRRKILLANVSPYLVCRLYHRK